MSTTTRTQYDADTLYKLDDYARERIARHEFGRGPLIDELRRRGFVFTAHTEAATREYVTYSLLTEQGKGSPYFVQIALVDHVAESSMLEHVRAGAVLFWINEVEGDEHCAWDAISVLHFDSLADSRKIARRIAALLVSDAQR